MKFCLKNVYQVRNIAPTNTLRTFIRVYNVNRNLHETE